MPSCLKGHSKQITNAIKPEEKVSEHAQKGVEMLKKKGGGGEGNERVKSAQRTEW
jgi:hypothetical protein